jgi:glycosyltransferase involved in cell wall biosynthesis
MKGSKGMENPNNHSPKVSIGMPVYNGGSFIKEALDSVLAQTFTDYELIISDNASDDDTQLICNEYCKKYPQIKYVRHKRNLGAYWNFNFVTQNAKGEFITWLAHDDVLEPMFLEETVYYMSHKPDTIIVASDFGIIDQAGIELGIEKLTKIRDHIDWGKRCVEFFRYPISNVFFCIYGLMKTKTCKAVLQSVSEPKIAKGSELPILARFAVAGEIAAIPIALRKYRRHPTSIYSSEVRVISNFSVLRRQLIKIANTYRLRLDQIIVLWSSSLSLSFKISISIKLLNYYSVLFLSRVLRIPSKMIGILKSIIIS